MDSLFTGMTDVEGDEIAAGVSDSLAMTEEAAGTGVAVLRKKDVSPIAIALE